VQLNRYRDDYYFETLSVLDEGGRTLWTAGPEVEQPHDAWVAARIDGDSVVAQAWSGYQVRFTATTGLIESVVFTS
jgi:hypothetical protein